MRQDGTMPVEGKETFVAVVEGDALLRESLGVYLRVLGCRVEVFSSSEEISDSGDLGRFGVVISDFHLPGEGGLSLLRRVREASTGVVTILITSQAAKDSTPETGADVIDGIVAKPFRTTVLDGMLRRLTGRDAIGGRFLPGVDASPGRMHNDG